MRDRLLIPLGVLIPVAVFFGLVGLVVRLGNTDTANSESTPESTTASAPAAGQAEYREALTEAKLLPVTDPTVPVPEYSRAAFGTAWADIDGNGCRQRDDLLARDLVDVTRDADGCTVLFGVLENDPYTGKTIQFKHDRISQPGEPGSAAIQGEHIVSLKAAWTGGAWKWTDEQRLQFANSLDDVIAVDGKANESKSDDGPAQWVPDTYYRCTYVTKYTQIATYWHLAVPRADRTALITNLTTCAGQK